MTIAWVKIRWLRKLSNEWRIDPGAICLPGGFNYNYNYITTRISDTEVTIAWVKIRKQFACQGASMAEPYKNYSFFAAELYLLITKRMRCSPTHTRENKVEKIKELPFSLHPNI